MFVIYVLFALDMLNMSLCIPIFNKHVISLGGSLYFIGLIGTGSALISLIWRPVAGSFSDTKGRKTVMLWCLIPNLLGNIFTYLSTSLYPLFFARLLCAFGTPIQTLLRTITADLISAKRTDASIFNKLGAVLSVCFMGGALVSGFISEYPHGTELIFLLISANVIISIVLANLLLEERPEVKLNKESSNSSVFEKFNTILKSINQLNWSSCWEVFTTKGLLDLSFGIMQMNMGLILLNDFHIEGRYMGYIFLLIGIISILTNLISVKLNSTYYKNDKGYLRIIHGCILLAISYIGLGVSHIYLTFLGFVATMSISRTVLDTALFQLLNNKTGENEKGIAVSLFDGIFSLAEITSPILSSIFATAFGEKNTLLLCFIPASLGAIITYYKKPPNSKMNIE